MDTDLARLYGATTKRLNEQVKRNSERFPGDFMFQLTDKEKASVVANCDHLARLKYLPALPYAFTEHGAIIAAGVLNTPKAVEVSFYIVRALVRIREYLETHEELARKLSSLEKKYDARFEIVFDALRRLMVPPEKPRRRIGF